MNKRFILWKMIFFIIFTGMCWSGRAEFILKGSFEDGLDKKIAEIVSLPSQEQILVKFNVSGYKGDTASLKATIKLKPEHVDPNDSIILQEETVEKFVQNKADIYINLKDFLPARYRLAIDIFDNKTVVYSIEEAIVVSEKPEWLKERVGIEALADDCVLPPFTPIKVKGVNEIEVWNRSYTIGSVGLPSKIITQQVSILKGPIRMNLLSSGKNILPEHKSELRKQAKGVVEYRGESTNKSVSITTSTRIEFDGFLLYTIEINPHGSINIDKLSLEIPLKSEYAVYMFAGGEPTERTIEGPQILDIGYSKVLEGEGVQWSSPYKESVWLGDDYRGLTWFCESEEYWYPQEYAARREALKIEKKGDTVQLIVNFICKQVALSKPIKYTFGFIPTPVRPKPAGWRGWEFTTYNPSIYDSEMKHGQKGNMVIYWPSPLWEKFSLSPLIADEEKYKELTLTDHAEGRTVLPYLAPQVVGFGIQKDGEWIEKDGFLTSEIINEWQLLPVKVAHQKRDKGDSVAYYVCPMSKWADYQVWLMQKHARCGADGIGILDGCSDPCSNQLHGCGYIDEQGNIKPTYFGLGVREICKRLLYMFIYERGDERRHITGLGLDHIHASNSTRSFVSSPFFDAGLKGEELNSGYWIFSPEYKKKIMVDKYYYANILPLEKFRIEFGHQWGWVPVFFPQLTKSPGIDKEWASSPEGTKDFLVLTLLHDCLVWPIWCNAFEVINTWKAKEKFGIADENVEFLPYYENQSLVKSSQEDVKVSIYRKPGKIMVIIANLSKEKKDVKVELNLKKIGLVEQPEKIFDAITNEPVILENNIFSLFLPPRDYKMIIIEK